MGFEIRYRNGHVEVYNRYGEFVFSADTVAEAYREMEDGAAESPQNDDVPAA